eukprot:TRINITY_DN8907_c0_g1_i1.p1 TRINITY_DN8907_c0_g1~~TRINITY_DN8907_c0_g1_i1.p1  ORF type:complete len:445 (+),score=84.88 TRINITY_DN8907_c0_g1_i1:45-1379(+)
MFFQRHQHLWHRRLYRKTPLVLAVYVLLSVLYHIDPSTQREVYAMPMIDSQGVYNGFSNISIGDQSLQQRPLPAQKFLTLFQGTDACMHVKWRNNHVPTDLVEQICFTRYPLVRLEKFARDSSYFYVERLCPIPRKDRSCNKHTWYPIRQRHEPTLNCSIVDHTPYLVIGRDHPNLYNPFHRTVFDLFPIYSLMTLMNESSFSGISLYLSDGAPTHGPKRDIPAVPLYKTFGFDKIILPVKSTMEPYRCFSNAVFVGSNFHWSKDSKSKYYNKILAEYVDFMKDALALNSVPPKKHPSILYVRRTYTRRVLNDEEIIAYIKQQYPEVHLDIWMNTPIKDPIQQIAQIRSYSMMMGVHGANFNDALYMRKNSTVLEILNYKYNVVMYKVMTGTTGKFYESYVVKRDDLIKNREPHYADVIVPMDEFKPFLDRIIRRMIDNPPALD